MLKESDLIRLEDEKPPKNKTVLFVWAGSGNGIERCQMSCGFLTDEDEIITDLKFIPLPWYWCRLF